MTLLRNVLGTLAVIGLMLILFGWAVPLLIGITVGVWITMLPIVVTVVIIILIALIVKSCNKKRA